MRSSSSPDTSPPTDTNTNQEYGTRHRLVAWWRESELKYLWVTLAAVVVGGTAMYTWVLSPTGTAVSEEPTRTAQAVVDPRAPQRQLGPGYTPTTGPASPTEAGPAPIATQEPVAHTPGLERAWQQKAYYLDQASTTPDADYHSAITPLIDGIEATSAVFPPPSVEGTVTSDVAPAAIAKTITRIINPIYGDWVGIAQERDEKVRRSLGRQAIATISTARYRDECVKHDCMPLVVHGDELYVGSVVDGHAASSLREGNVIVEAEMTVNYYKAVPSVAYKAGDPPAFSKQLRVTLTPSGEQLLIDTLTYQ